MVEKIGSKTTSVHKKIVFTYQSFLNYKAFFGIDFCPKQGEEILGFFFIQLDESGYVVEYKQGGRVCILKCRPSSLFKPKGAALL